MAECNSADAPPKYVFVYGTLKRGQPNHFFFEEETNGKARFICRARSVDKYPLLVATRFNLPFLLHSDKIDISSEIGHIISGEIFEVDSKMLDSLDDFEEYPEVYNRSLKHIEVIRDLDCDTAANHSVLKDIGASNTTNSILNNENTSRKKTSKEITEKDGATNYTSFVPSTFQNNEDSAVKSAENLSADKTIVTCWIYHLENFPMEILEKRPLLSNYDAYAQVSLYSLQEDNISGDNVYESMLEDCRMEETKVTIGANTSRDMSTASTTADIDSILAAKDQVQVNLMKEECILIDKDDQKVGFASKKDCHLLSNINKGMLHRAFSVFLFNTEGQLLLQQRSGEKITFPGHWTNTCCSHPLSLAGEGEETEALGVRRAAQRKLKHELGIEPSQVPLDDFTYLTRIHYQSPNVPADGVFGEHEIDYILFIQKDVHLKPNSNEVRDYRYVDRQGLQDIVEESNEKGGLVITPWFRLIAESFLTHWWDNLQSLDRVKQQDTIHRMT